MQRQLSSRRLRGHCMKQITANFKGHYKEIILGPLFKLLEAVLELMVPLVMANIIDIGIASGDSGYVIRGGLLLLGLAVMGAASGLTCQYFAAVAGGHFGRRLRQQMYDHVMRFSAVETGRYGAGGLITRVTNDVNQVQSGVNMAIRLGTRVPFLAIGSIVMALRLNFRIGLIFLAGVAVITLILVLIMRRTLPGYSNIQAGQDRLSRLAGENLDGVRVIRAFSRQKQETQDFDEAGDAMTVLLVRVGKLSAALNPLTTFVTNLAILAIVWVGAGFAFRGEAAPGEIIALVSYMNQTLLALLVAANLVVLFTRALASTRRVAEVLDTQPSVTDGPGVPVGEGSEKAAPALEFDNVHFAYQPGADDALEEVSFAVAPGQTLGIIGGTGSGKTTLVNLLLRYFDVTCGAVRIAGHDVRSYTLAQLRGRIGLVPQNATLLTGSVRHNLAVADSQADDDTLWQALELAQADFVQQMPGGLDAAITEGGANLSGGQKQRLTIARALVRRPSILILDDASSALDYATDARLRRGLRREAAARAEQHDPMTVVMVSQRASAIRHADLVLVMDDGRLVASGTHDQLLETSPVYREICVSQGVSTGEVG